MIHANRVDEDRLGGARARKQINNPVPDVVSSLGSRIWEIRWYFPYLDIKMQEAPSRRYKYTVYLTYEVDRLLKRWHILIKVRGVLLMKENTVKRLQFKLKINYIEEMYIL